MPVAMNQVGGDEKWRLLLFSRHISDKKWPPKRGTTAVAEEPARSRPNNSTVESTDLSPRLKW